MYEQLIVHNNSHFKIILLLILFNCIYFFFFSVISIRNISAIGIRKAMEEQGVVNDVIDTVPPHAIEVKIEQVKLIRTLIIVFLNFEKGELLKWSCC